jgi:hypothetical protein
MWVLKVISLQAVFGRKRRIARMLSGSYSANTDIGGIDVDRSDAKVGQVAS